MTFEGSIIGLICLVLMVAYYWTQLFENEEPATRRWIWGWICRGVVVPSIVWVGINSGLSTRLPPLMPHIAAAKLSGWSWIPTLLDLTAPGLLVIGSYWAATTLGWQATLIASRVRSRVDFISLSAFWLVVGLPVVWLALYLSGWMGMGFAALVCLTPIVHCTLSLAPAKKPHPIYSRAIAKMKFGKYSEAEAAVIGELEKSEDDFDGWMMLADLYANHFNDLPEADRTIRELCQQPNISGVQVSIALHRLADWHLKLGGNPAGARSALEALCLNLPGSHFARMARQRLDQLPASREELEEQRKIKPIRLPALNESLDEKAESGSSAGSEQDAAASANQCVEKLKRDPNNILEREKLARIFAERLGRAGLAIEQLELLIGMPGQPAQKAAEWLGLIAAWQLRYQQNPDAARKLLERLIREYPETAQAFAAQRRLNLIEMELRISKARTAALP
jgi:hypothetical protein